MGQKTNPNIFRLTKTAKWKSKYIEKKTNELYLYTIQDLEIRKFIIKFFQDHGLTVHNCRFNYSTSALTVFISYQQNINSTSLLSDINKTQKITLVKNRVIHTNTQKRLYNNLLSIIKNLYNYESMRYKSLFGPLKPDQFPKKILKMKRLKLLNYYKRQLLLKKESKIINLKKKSFMTKLLNGISEFLQNKADINLFIEPITSDKIVNKKQHSALKKKLVKLRKYQRNEFFKEGTDLAFTCLNNSNSAYLLSQFIAIHLKKLKRHNFFLKFIKNILTIFIVKTFSSVGKGIKIKVKGRFNGAPRAKYKIINIGKAMPVLTLNSKIDYSETTAYTSNGTFGVKVWIYEK